MSADTPTPSDEAKRQPWWLAGALFLAAFALVVAVVAASYSAGSLVDGPAAISVAGSRFGLIRGRGHAYWGAFVLEALDNSQLGIVSTKTEPIAAESYPRVECRLTGFEPESMQLSLLWRTREQPNQNFHVNLDAWDPGVVSAELAAQDDWSGTVTGVGLAVQGELYEPLVVQSCTFPSASVRTAAATIARQWGRLFAFKGTTINLPFDAERGDYASLLIVVAIAAGLAMGTYYLLARRRHWRRDPGAFLAVFLIGWLLLDARWQVDLWRQLGLTAQQFAGKTTEQKHEAETDHAVFELMQKVDAALPTPPVRVHFLADNSKLRARGAFFLYPQNVYHDLRPSVPSVTPEQLRSGDYALLLGYSGLTYEREQQLLLWPDGSSKSVEAILVPNKHTELLRIR